MNPSYVPKRTVLYTPANRTDRIRKALEAGRADVVVADLEDGVSPTEKDKARDDVARLLQSSPNSRSLLAVRINRLEDETSRADLEALMPHPPAVIVVPKAEGAQELDRLIDRLTHKGVKCQLFLMIETAKGLLNAEYLAGAPRVQALIFGAEDYAASVGAVRTPEGMEVLFARSHVVACAAAAGLDAIDQVWTDFHDHEGLRRDALAGARLGFAGKQIIHPDQIPVVHEAYAPSPQDFERARRIVEAFDAAGGGVVVVDGQMIDRPLVEQARRVLERGRVPP